MQEILGVTKLVKEHMDVTVSKDSDVAMGGVNWREEGRADTEGDQCLRDLACDEAGFADVGEEMALVVSRRVWMKARVWEWLMRS